MTGVAAAEERAIGRSQPSAVALSPSLLEAREDIIVTIEDPDGPAR